MKKLNMTNVYTMPCKPGSVYVSFGEDCLNDCRFCVKRFENFFGYSLDPHFDKQTVEKIEKGLERIAKINSTPKEVVICGIGEPFLHYDELINISKKSRQLFGSKVPVRADTTGLWFKSRRCLSFLDHIDSLSISLNAESEDKYNVICQPRISDAYAILNDFLGALKNERQKRKENNLIFPDVRLTIVNTADKEFMPEQKGNEVKSDCPIPDIGACKRIAEDLGFPLVVKHLFRDVSECHWDPKYLEKMTLSGGYLEKCQECKYRHL